MLLPTPCICTKNSVLILLAESFSPSLRCPQSESISSMKMIEGLRSLAMLKSCLIKRSDSPIHLETRSEEEMEKKVPSHSVAQALAKKDLPVPGGPYKRIPLQGWRTSSKSCGNLIGRTTASFNPSLAPSRPETSSQLTLGLSETIADASAPYIFSSSLFSSPPPPPVPAAGFYACAVPPEAGSSGTSSTVFLIYSALCRYCPIFSLYNLTN